ncbi:hypothetical protein GEV33_001643 [Tenebrio molitor]|uniref:Uncharacterized protein n=1 Tax=Tenebrio molitor TaxID=7067 RepID=A0A8J6HUX3_TENMO|nr:hypothetical protein GEV33_001643 [Tenebrio molitor]
MEAGKFVERRGLRLQDGYATHMAELYALGSAIKSVAGRRGIDINFATDSIVALDMLTERRGGIAHAIHKELKRIKDKVFDGEAVVVFRPTQRNRRGGQNREEGQRKARGVSGRASPHHGEDAQEGSDKGIHGEVANRMGPRRDRKDDTRRHQDSGHKASRGYLRRFHLSETTGECICSTGSQDTAQYIIEEEGSQGGLRRRQEAIGGAFPFRVTRLTKDEEVRNFNKFAEETKMEEETSRQAGGVPKSINRRSADRLRGLPAAIMSSEGPYGRRFSPYPVPDSGPCSGAKLCDDHFRW